jgi:hypothetical protein
MAKRSCDFMCLDMARLWCPDVWSHTTLAIAVKVLFWI